MFHGGAPPMFEVPREAGRVVIEKGTIFLASRFF